VRTTIELKPEHRARLADLAARKGAKGFSSIIAEAIDVYLGSEPHQIETVPITTLATAGLKLQRDIPIVIEQVDGGFVATFFDANLSMSGDTQEEAFRNVRGLIADIFSDLDSEPADRLGPGPKMQINVLRSFIARVPAGDYEGSRRENCGQAPRDDSAGRQPRYRRHRAPGKANCPIRHQAWFAARCRPRSRSGQHLRQYAPCLGPRSLPNVVRTVDRSVAG